MTRLAAVFAIAALAFIGMPAAAQNSGFFEQEGMLAFIQASMIGSGYSAFRCSLLSE